MLNADNNVYDYLMDSTKIPELRNKTFSLKEKFLTF
jgi:hypothetical protein